MGEGKWQGREGKSWKEQCKGERNESQSGRRRAARVRSGSRDDQIGRSGAERWLAIARRRSLWVRQCDKVNRLAAVGLLLTGVWELQHHLFRDIWRRFRPHPLANLKGGSEHVVESGALQNESVALPPRSRLGPRITTCMCQICTFEQLRHGCVTVASQLRHSCVTVASWLLKYFWRFQRF